MSGITEFTPTAPPERLFESSFCDHLEPVVSFRQKQITAGMVTVIVLLGILLIVPFLAAGTPAPGHGSGEASSKSHADGRVNPSLRNRQNKTHRARFVRNVLTDQERRLSAEERKWIPVLIASLSDFDAGFVAAIALHELGSGAQEEVKRFLAQRHSHAGADRVDRVSQVARLALAKDPFAGLISLQHDPYPKTSLWAVGQLEVIAKEDDDRAGQAVGALAKTSRMNGCQARARAARAALGRLKSRLLELARIPHPRGQIPSIFALEELHRHGMLDKDSKKRFLSDTVREQTPAVRVVKTLVLVNIGYGHQADEKVLGGAMLNPRSPSKLRALAAVAIGRLGRTSPWIEQALVAALADPDAKTRLEAARSLGSVADCHSPLPEMVLSQLADTAGKSHDRMIQEAALSSMEVIRARRAKVRREKLAIVQASNRRIELARKQADIVRQRARDLYRHLPRGFQDTHAPTREEYAAWHEYYARLRQEQFQWARAHADSTGRDIVGAPLSKSAAISFHLDEAAVLQEWVAYFATRAAE